ncbi:YveK family protein [Enterococcus bulliens]
MEQVYSTKQLLTVFGKHIKLIIIFGLLGIAVSAILTFFVITPKYSSQAQLVVTLPQTENTNVNDVNSNLQMINTYKDFIVSDLVLNQVEDRLKSDYKMKMNPEEIKASVSVSQNQNSQMFSIIAKSKSANEAAKIANTVANIFKENAKDVLNVDRITIISSATTDTTPVSPNNKLFITLGLLIGLLLGLGLSIVVELMDRTVKDSQFVVEELGFTVLGTVPEISDKEITNYIKKAKKISLDSTKNSKQNTEIEQNTEIKRRRSRI